MLMVVSLMGGCVGIMGKKVMTRPHTQKEANKKINEVNKSEFLTGLSKTNTNAGIRRKWTSKEWKQI